MLLQPDPGLAEVPGFSRKQLDALARSVELRRQQLEHDIQDYIRHRQDDLRSYEQELLAHHRSMARDDESESATAVRNAENIEPSSASSEQSAPLLSGAQKPEPEEKAKRTKHSRVQKREKELYGLVTPVFLPLLDARDTSPQQEKKTPTHKSTEAAPAPADREHTTPTRHAERTKERKSRREHTEMDDGAAGEASRDTTGSDSSKKSKRSTVKKSSLRQHNTSRSRRKRVSLVIDGQTVLPADTVVEHMPTSPSSEATSASNSTASLDDMIDPRLTRHDPPAHTEHHDAVHHSLPLPMSNNMHSPTKPITGTPSSMTNEAANSSRSPITPLLTYNPPSAAIHTFLDPSPAHNTSLPATAGPEPIFADDPILDEETEDRFDTYVGGLHGSGVDDVDQAGSYGYPSSLGASYLESYMQSRPLRVRMEAADKAGLDEHEKKEMLKGDKKEDEMDVDLDVGNVREAHVDADEDMDIMGEMEGF
ncbi:hypothetical protein BKA63DRAFT_168215 [Paraphoma chrysanthemicola]|nr:hypothetical protein BKA63DRAFT_168215 [Paraphoma chrysanthemicola]